MAGPTQRVWLALACILCVGIALQAPGAAAARELTSFTPTCSGSVAYCLVDPCTNPKPPGCPATMPATAECFSSYRAKCTYKGQTVGPCGVIWIDTASGKALCTSNTKVAAPKLTCAGGSVQCLVDPCSNPLPASCPGKLPTTAKCLPCYSNKCTYKGAVAGPCGVIVVDTATSKPLCSSGAPKSEGTKPAPIALTCEGANNTCFADPCALPPPASCPATMPATAQCFASYNEKCYYKGYGAAQCGVIYIDTATRQPICSSGSAYTEPTCSGAIARCVADPCSVPPPTNCKLPDKPLCVPSYRSSCTINGISAGICQALYLDPLTNNVLCASG